MLVLHACMENFIVMKKYEKLFYPVVFHPEEVGYSTSVPSIDGCFSQGDDMNEAVEMTQDAIGLMLEDYFESGKAVPRPLVPNDHILSEGEFFVMVEFDELSYRKRHENKAIKKTLTIPSWLNHLAEEQGLNFSRILQNALKEELNVQ